MVRATFCYNVAECPIRYGLPLLRLLAPPCKGPSEHGFYHPVESSPCILQPIAIFATPLWRRSFNPTTSQRPVMPTLHAPLFPSHLFLSSSLTSLHSNILLPRILRATSPPFLKKASDSNHVIERGINWKQTFPNEQLTNVFSWLFLGLRIIGNFYSINNYSESRSARIFFAQGCEVNVEVENTPI